MCRLTDTGEGTGRSPFTEVLENEHAFASWGNGCRNRIRLPGAQRPKAPSAIIGTEACLKREWWHSDLGAEQRTESCCRKAEWGTNPEMQSHVGAASHFASVPKCSPF